MESEASHSISSLPAELVTEIVLKLPVKSLLKFKCVSKSWLALISSPEFIKIHLGLNANNKEYTHHKLFMVTIRMRYTPKYSFRHCNLSSLFNESRVTKAKYLDYPFNPFRKMPVRVEYRQKQSGVSIAGSANGLICLVIDHKELVLWNPSIRKYKKLPDPMMAPACVSWRVYGFGYDELHDDFKVIIFNESEIFCSYEFKVKIYSLRSDSWRCLDNCPRMVRLSGKFVNGKLHWITGDDSSLLYLATGCDVYMTPKIVSIDLADEKWGEMELPCYDEGRIHSKVEALGSDLSVVCNCNETHLDVWVMKEYGVKESWTKMFTIKYPENLSQAKQRCLHMTNEGEILVVIGSNFMIYNPKSDSLRYSEVIDFGVWNAEEIYVESLVCPMEAPENAQIKTKLVRVLPCQVCVCYFKLQNKC